MKINPAKLELVHGTGLGFFVYGSLSDELKQWVIYHNLKTKTVYNGVIIVITENPLSDQMSIASVNNGYISSLETSEVETDDLGLNISNLFEEGENFKFVDGFSPNLNKRLHVGHLGNLVIAKCLQSLGIGECYISILGDTLEPAEEDINNDTQFEEYKNLCKRFNYRIDRIYKVSEMKCPDDLLFDGEGEYKDTKVLNIGSDKVVGIKSNGSTTYAYQDVALIHELKDKTLYITGSEQTTHFEMLASAYPQVKHLPLGLIMLDNKKQSSRIGNVVYISEVYQTLEQEIEDDDLIHNIIIGSFLSRTPSSPINLNLATLTDKNQSTGLYISYTMARLVSAGIEIKDPVQFNSKRLEFQYLVSKFKCNPYILLRELYNYCRIVNFRYEKIRIKDNEKAIVLFTRHLNDIVFAANKLGMRFVKKV